MIFAVKKLANKITEGLRTFQKCLLEKKGSAIFTSHERSRRQATNTISVWNSYQIRGWGAEFPVIHGLEEPKLLHTEAFT